MFSPIDWGWFLWFGWCYTVAGLTGMTMALVDWKRWYAELRKAPWNPPNWLFGVVWPVLYGLRAAASTLAWKSPETAQSVEIYEATVSMLFASLVFNALWTPLFFGFRWLLLAQLVLFFAATTTWAACALSFFVSTTAGALLVPESVWLAFAFTLGLYAALMNEPERSSSRFSRVA